MKLFPRAYLPCKSHQMWNWMWAGKNKKHKVTKLHDMQSYQDLKQWEIQIKNK